MRPIHFRALPFLAALLLAACGGGNSGSDVVVTDPVRGQLLQNPPELVSTVTAPALLLALNALANQQLLAISGTPLCDVAVHNIRYATVGGANEATTASGAMMVPLGGAPDALQRFGKPDNRRPFKDGLFVYGQSGVYTVDLVVTDGDGASASSSYQYVVVYAPDGAPFSVDLSASTGTLAAQWLDPVTGRSAAQRPPPSCG